MPRHDADLYDYLATSKVSEVTVAQLGQSLENSFINKSNIEFWKGPITVHRLLEVSRTYPWALPIPERGAVDSTLVEPLGTYTIQPTGTEIWDIKHIWAQGTTGTATVSFSFTDGVTDSPIQIAAAVDTAGRRLDLNETTSAPVFLTSSLYLKIEETGGAYPVALFIARQVVGL